MKFLVGIFFLILSISSFASEVSGYCEDVAVKKALKASPGRDPELLVTLSKVKLVRTEVVDSKTSVEKYYVRTEDQDGGAAASFISVEVKDVSSVLDEVLKIKCRVIAQKWVE